MSYKPRTLVRGRLTFDGLKVDIDHEDQFDPKKQYDYQDINLRYYGLPEVRVEEYNESGKTKKAKTQSLLFLN